MLHFISFQVFWFPDLAASIVNGSKSTEDWMTRNPWGSYSYPGALPRLNRDIWGLFMGEKETRWREGFLDWAALETNQVLSDMSTNVALSDPESTKFQCYSEPSLSDWRTLMYFNVVLTVFHIDHISQRVCKNVRTTFQCIIVLRGKGPENLSQICF